MSELLDIAPRQAPRLLEEIAQRLSFDERALAALRNSALSQLAVDAQG
jgi:hypothetical protein